MLNKVQLSSKIKPLSIEKISKETNFSLRTGSKVDASSLLTSFFMMISKRQNSLLSWAAEFTQLTGKLITDKGIESALVGRREEFAKKLLEHVIEKDLEKECDYELAIVGVERFNKVYIEDSTCFSLPSMLHEYFKGPNSPIGSKVATAKVQLRLELKTGKYTRIELQSFRDNDQKFSPDILSQVEQNDLVIRDLGYSVLKVFRKLDEKGAFFLSHLKSGTSIFNMETEAKVNLAKLLRKATRKRKKVLEVDVLLGAKEKLAVRLVAVKASNKVARKRRELAKKDRHSKANHSKEYLELLGWTLMITNIPETVLSARELLKIYGYRWRIEIIFKAWKSSIGFDKFFSNKRRMKKERAIISFYFMLIWLTLFLTGWYQYFQKRVYEKANKFISLLKFAKFALMNFERLVMTKDLSDWTQMIKFNCVYDSRKKYLNSCEKMYLFE